VSGDVLQLTMTYGPMGSSVTSGAIVAGASCTGVRGSNVPIRSRLPARSTAMMTPSVSPSGSSSRSSGVSGVRP
jgi:hypothetical protein